MESRCRFTRINGARCSMPALNGHELCYEHQQRKRQAQRKPVPSDPQAPGPLVNLVYMDDHTSVLANLNAIAEAFAYGLINHHQVSALNRLMQTCLKTLSQKREHEPSYLNPEYAVKEVTYDEDGFALAVDPPPAPEPAPGGKRKRPRYAVIGSGIGLGNTVELSAGASHKPDLGPASEMTTAAEPNSPASVEPPGQELSSFQTLTSTTEDKPPVFKHLPPPPKTNPLFSNTSAPLDAINPLQLAIGDPSTWNPSLTRSILKALR